MSIALFIPVHNEEETLGDLLNRIPKKIGNYDVDIVVVDDGSKDNSAEVAKNYTEHVTKTSKNFGVGFATRLGFEYIVATRKKYEYILKIDGDGQHRLSFLSKVVETLERGADVVVCSRFHPDSEQKETPIDRMLLNGMFSGILSRITGWEISDARSGFMGFRADYIEEIASEIIVRRYGIPMEILLRIWARHPKAVMKELAHPAVYGGEISQKLTKKYSTEDKRMKSDRVREAYLALLNVLEDLNVSCGDVAIS